VDLSRARLAADCPRANRALKPKPCRALPDDQLAGSPVRTVNRGTVVAALETYLTNLRRHDRREAANKAEGQFKTALNFNGKTKQYDDALAELSREHATKDDLLEWRDRLASRRPAESRSESLSA
jgi:hypothetical protein